MPPITNVFSLGLQDETQRHLVASSSSNADSQVAFVVRNASKQTPKPTNGKKERPLCTHCGMLGHTIEKCYKIHAYPQG